MSTLIKVCLAFVVGCCFVARADTLPASVFAARPAIENVRISPDGRYLLYKSAHEGRDIVLTWDLHGSRDPVSVLSVGLNADVSWCRWVNATRLICAVRRAWELRDLHPYNITELVAVDADGKNAGVLFTFGAVNDTVAQQLVGIGSDGGSILLHSRAPDYSKVRSEVARLHVTSGEYQVIARPTRRMPRTLTFIGDPKGEVFIARGFAGKDLGFWSFADGKWQTMFKFDPLLGAPRAVPLAIIPGTGRAYGIGRGQDHAALYEIELERSADERLIYESSDADVTAPVLSADGTALGVKLDAERPSVHYFNRREASLIESIDKLLPGAFNEIIDHSADKKRYVIRSSSDVDAGSFFLLEASKPSADMQLIGKTHPDLEPSRLTRTRTITIRLEDGKSRRAYFSTPTQDAAIVAPLIVMPDDGLNGRAEWRFSFLRHFLLSRGYAVLQVQLDETASAHDYSAVRKDLDGVAYAFLRQSAKWAIQQGLAERERIATVGWGFGGYVALLGSRNDPDLFQCAIGINAVTDLDELPGNNKLTHLIGRSSASRIPIRSASPNYSPILLAHGLLDAVVHPHHSHRVPLSNRDGGLSDERVYLEGGTHQLSNPKARTQLLEIVDAFLKRRIGASNRSSIKASSDSGAED